MMSRFAKLLICLLALISWGDGALWAFERDLFRCRDQVNSLGVFQKVRDGVSLRVFSHSLAEILSQAQHVPEDQIVIYPLKLWKFGADRQIVLANRKAYLFTPHAVSEKRVYGWYQYVELEVIDRQIVMKGKTTFTLGSVLPLIHSPLGRYSGWRYQLDENLKVWFRETLNESSGEFGSELSELLKLRKIQRAPKFHTFKAIAARAAVMALLVSPFPLGQTSSLTGKMIPPILSPVHQLMAQDLNYAMNDQAVWAVLNERAFADGRGDLPKDFGISGFGQLTQVDLIRLWSQAKAAESFVGDESRKKEWFLKLAAAVDDAIMFGTDTISFELLDDIAPRYSFEKADPSRREISIVRILDLAPYLDTQGTFWPSLLEKIPENSKWLSWNRNPQTAPFYDPAVDLVFDSFPVDVESRDRAKKAFDGIRKGDYEIDSDLARLSLLREFLKKDSASINEILKVLRALDEYQIPESDDELNALYEARILIPVLKEAYGGDEQKVTSTLIDTELMDIVILNQRGDLKRTVGRIAEALPEEQFLRFMKDLASSAPGIVSSRVRAFYADRSYEWLERRFAVFQADQETFDKLIELVFKISRVSDSQNSILLRDLAGLVALTSDPVELERRIDLLILHVQKVNGPRSADVFEMYERIAEDLPFTVFAREPEGLDLTRQLKVRILKAIAESRANLAQ